MKIHLEKAIFINRAPFDELNLGFNENEITVLSAANGKGKTTILSHIIDSIYDMVRPYFQDFEDKTNKFYRVSSHIYNLDLDKASFVYLRFKTQDGAIDYVDIRNNCTEEEYNNAIALENKIPFSEIETYLKQANYVKKLSSNFSKEKAQQIFSNNIMTYFPSYRYEIPGYLNEPYKIKLDFKKQNQVLGYLNNPIEVISGLPELANWIMDIVLDMQYAQVNGAIPKNNLDAIISQILVSKKHDNLRFGIGPRGFGSTRIQIVDYQTAEQIYPSIFNLSSGESSLFCLFGELLRQADNYRNNIQLTEVTGIVIIDVFCK